MSKQDKRRLLDRVVGGRISATAARTSGMTVVLTGATLVFNLGTTLLLTNLIGARGYGIYIFAIAAANLLGVPAVLGLVPLVIRTVASYRVHESWSEVRGVVRRSQQTVLCTSAILVTGAVLVGLGFRGGRPEIANAFLIGLVLVPLTALTTMRQAIIQAFDRVVLARVPETVVQPIVFIVLVVAAAATNRLDGTVAVLLNVVATGIAFLLGLHLLRQVLPAGVGQATPQFHTREWLRSAIPLLLLTGVNTLNQQVDVLMLGAFRDASASGLYSVAWRAATTVSFFLTAATYPLSPLFARLWTTGAKEELQRVVTLSSRVVFVGALLIASTLILFRVPILELFGDGFSQGSNALIILSIGQLINAGTGTVGLVLMMIGRESDVTRAVAVAATAGFVLNLVLIPPFGLEGAAWATATAVTLNNLLLVRRLWQREHIWAGAIGTRLAARQGSAGKDLQE